MNLNDFIKLALAEDIGAADYTSLSCIPDDATGKAKLLAKKFIPGPLTFLLQKKTEL